MIGVEIELNAAMTLYLIIVHRTGRKYTMRALLGIEEKTQDVYKTIYIIHSL